jgi:hypothetical protein
MITESFSPILAEIADKMPTVFGLWKGWSIAALADRNPNAGVGS